VSPYGDTLDNTLGDILDGGGTLGDTLGGTQGGTQRGALDGTQGGTLGGTLVGTPECQSRVEPYVTFAHPWSF